MPGMPMPGAGPPGPVPMPGLPGMGGGAPPGGGPPGGTGGAAMPTGMPGSAQSAETSVKLALEALQKALPGLPMGSDLHTVVLKAVSDIAKHMNKGGSSQQDVMQQLVALARQQQTKPNPMMGMAPSPGAMPGSGPPLPGGAAGG